MDALHITVLLTGVDDMAKRLGESPEAFGNFRCTEVDAIVTVLAIAGHESTAAQIIAGHAAADEELRDRHAHVWDLIQRTNHGTPPVMEAATAYVRDLVDAHLTDQWARPTPPRSEPPATDGVGLTAAEARTARREIADQQGWNGTTLAQLTHRFLMDEVNGYMRLRYVEYLRGVQQGENEG